MQPQNTTAKVTLTCHRCGKEFTRYPSQVTARSYCSRACALPPTKVRVECAECGKVTMHSPSLAGKYCSRQCGAAARAKRTWATKGIIRCVVCNTEISHPQTAQKYCSRQCRGIGTAQVRKAKPKPPKRAFVCQKCGTEFQRPRLHTRHPPKFCSKACGSSGRAPHSLGRSYTTQCAECSKEFMTILSVRSQFCSKECGYAHRRRRALDAMLPWSCPQCGKAFPLESRTYRYCSPECAVAAHQEGKTLKAGYIVLYIPGRGYIGEHRYVMEQHLHRALRRSEHVHHKNGIRHDNHIENLEIVAQHEHHRLHTALRRAAKERLMHESASS